MAIDIRGESIRITVVANIPDFVVARVSHPVPVRIGEAIIGDTVAVIVEAIANFRGQRIHKRILVIAITAGESGGVAGRIGGALGEAVEVGVGTGGMV